MKKYLIFILLVILAVLIDGSLAYDILDYKIDTPFRWLGLFLILGILGALLWTDGAKKRGNGNNQE